MGDAGDTPLFVAAASSEDTEGAVDQCKIDFVLARARAISSAWDSGHSLSKTTETVAEAKNTETVEVSNDNEEHFIEEPGYIVSGGRSAHGSKGRRKVPSAVAKPPPRCMLYYIGNHLFVRQRCLSCCCILVPVISIVCQFS